MVMTFWILLLQWHDYFCRKNKNTLTKKKSAFFITLMHIFRAKLSNKGEICIAMKVFIYSSKRSACSIVSCGLKFRSRNPPPPSKAPTAVCIINTGAVSPLRLFESQEYCNDLPSYCGQCGFLRHYFFFPFSFSKDYIMNRNFFILNERTAIEFT